VHDCNLIHFKAVDKVIVKLITKPAMQVILAFIFIL
jgi:hypothetical protein